MEKILQKKNNFTYWLLIISSFLMYILLTSSKNLYTANKTTLYSLGTFGTLTDLSITYEFYAYSYAAMQVCLIFFIKKINIKWFLTCTIGVSAILTSLMAFTNTIVQHYVIYTINGALQAGIWGCIFKNLSRYLPKNFLAKGNSVMSTGPTVSYTISYAVAALFGENWSLPFLIMGIILFCSVLLYFFSVTLVSRINKNQETSTSVNKILNENAFIPLKSTKGKISFFAISLLFGFIITSIYFMLNNNVDFFLKEVGQLTNSQCKLLTIIVTIVMVIGPIITIALCEKYRNFLLVGGTILALAFIMILLLTLFFEVNIILSLILFITFLLIVNGARTISLSIVALKERSVVDTGVYTTAVNALASIAAGIAPKFLATIIDNPALSTIQSWRISFTIVLVATVALSITLLLLGYIFQRKNTSV